MLESAWAFLKDPANRQILEWIGGGIVVLAGGAWAVVKFFVKQDHGDKDGGVRAEHGSVAAGRDIAGSTITIVPPDASKP
jgi:hypothetical protein